MLMVLIFGQGQRRSGFGRVLFRGRIFFGWIVGRTSSCLRRIFRSFLHILFFFFFHFLFSGRNRSARGRWRSHGAWNRGRLRRG
jgi:hypothetical protein